MRHGVEALTEFCRRPPLFPRGAEHLHNTSGRLRIVLTIIATGDSDKNRSEEVSAKKSEDRRKKIEVRKQVYTGAYES
jgi:hypothetical protein